MQRKLDSYFLLSSTRNSWTRNPVPTLSGLLAAAGELANVRNVDCGQNRDDRDDYDHLDKSECLVTLGNSSRQIHQGPSLALYT